MQKKKVKDGIKCDDILNIGLAFCTAYEKSQGFL
jgi:hypothetical protein